MISATFVEYRPSESRILSSEQILPLFREVFGHEMSVQHWEWKYRGPPGAYSLHVVAFADESEQVPIGHVGALLLPGLWRGKAILMAQLMDVMVHRQARSGLGRAGVYGQLMLRMARILSEMPQPLFAYGFPGATPARLGQRLGFYRLLNSVQEVSLSNACVSQSWFAAIRSRWLSSLLSQQFYLERVPEGGGVRDHLIPVSNGRSDVPLVRKDIEYMIWRYENHPHIRYHKWKIVGRTGSEVGWLITSTGEKPLVIDVHPASLVSNSARVERLLTVLAQSTGRNDWAMWVNENYVTNNPSEGFVYGVLKGRPGSVYPGEFLFSDLCGSGRDVLNRFAVSSDHLFMPGDTDVF